MGDDRTAAGVPEDATSADAPSAAANGSPALPSHIGSFRIIRLLGEGGMGLVYEAEQDNPRRTIALKVIRAALSFLRG